MFRFNSLQTGNCIQTIAPLLRNRDHDYEFQFPSNGKLHSNSARKQPLLLKHKKFQFPSNGKLHSNVVALTIIAGIIVSFNSLQTGNCIQTSVRGGNVIVEIKFQFPSNGKLHSNLCSWRQCYSRDKVSIPFKRETAFKQGTSVSFLERGKVSIPFKRETAFKHRTRIRSQDIASEFQFPSNGKLHSNGDQYVSLNMPDLVSIPFKRETAFKRSILRRPLRRKRTVSIPFKRETAFKRGLSRGFRGGFNAFQFPSNGKLHSNCSYDEPLF